MNICISHNFVIKHRSNALQQDEMGYPLRLFISECTKCGKTKQEWIDVNESELEELRTGKSVLVKWDEN